MPFGAGSRAVREQPSLLLTQRSRVRAQAPHLVSPGEDFSPELERLS